MTKQIIRVILIEDFEYLHGVLTTFLEKHDIHVVKCFTNRNDAFDFVSTNKNFDIIITDISLNVEGDIEGLKCLTDLRELTDAPFIVFSGHTKNSIIQLANNAGCYSYVIKSTKHEPLLYAILSVFHNLETHKTIRKTNDDLQRQVMLKELSKSESVVFNLLENSPTTLSEISNKLKISKETIRGIYKKIRTKLKIPKNASVEEAVTKVKRKGIPK